MTIRQAMDFIRYHGVVLKSAKGLEPSLVVRIVGGPIHGSWWGHPMGREIYALTNMIDKSNAVLTCTLASGKITYIHRRLWPAFVRMAGEFPCHSLDKVQQIHLPSGRHKRYDIKFPDWVPESALNSAKRLSALDASAEIEVWLQRYNGA